MHADEDVLKRRQALVEANVLEGARKASNHHVVRPRRSRDADALDQAVVPVWANDVQKERANESKERDGDRSDPLDESSVATHGHQEVDR